jgi:hemin uptake protein HemP
MHVGSEKHPPSGHGEATNEIQPPARKINVIAHRIDSVELFVDTREIIISHGGDAYRLRLTSQNKLILTK